MIRWQWRDLIVDPRRDLNRSNRPRLGWWHLAATTSGSVTRRKVAQQQSPWLWPVTQPVALEARIAKSTRLESPRAAVSPDCTRSCVADLGSAYSRPAGILFGSSFCPPPDTRLRRFKKPRLAADDKPIRGWSLRDISCTNKHKTTECSLEQQMH